MGGDTSQLIAPFLEALGGHNLPSIPVPGAVSFPLAPEEAREVCLRPASGLVSGSGSG